MVNAIIHRQYTNVGSEVTVDIYDDRIEVTSPGPMASGLIFNGEPTVNVPSIRRNPIIADVFARMRFMERRGSGFDKIKNGTNRLFADNNNHVKFIASETFFRVVIENANYKKKTKNNKVRERGKEISNQILEQIQRDPKITVIDLAAATKTTEKTIRYYINKLRKGGIITRQGSNKFGTWKVIK